MREQFGTPIGRFQAIKHLCVEMPCRASRWHVAIALTDQRQAPVAVRLTAGQAGDNPQLVALLDNYAGVCRDRGVSGRAKYALAYHRGILLACTVIAPASEPINLRDAPSPVTVP